MVSKGKVQAEEMRGQLGERLPGAYQAAARAMGKTTEEFSKMMEDGELVAEDLLPKLSVELMKMANSGDQLEKAMNNTNSALNRFSNNMILANARFQEAGMDKGIRDLANSASDFLMRADEIWTLMGTIGPVLFTPFRALFELFGALSDRFGQFADTVKTNEDLMKIFAAIIAALFGWSRKLLYVFVLIPGALSGMAKIIDGEQLTWAEWLTTLLGILAALEGIVKIKSKISGFAGKGPLKAGAAVAGGGLLGGLLKAGTMKVAVVSFLGLSAFGALASTLYDAFFGAGPSARTGAQFGDKFGSNLALPQSSGGGVPEKIRNTLQTPASEFEFGMPQMPDFFSKFNYMLNRTAESQAIVSGDITFNITGDNSKEIADEVLRVIHSDVIRPTSLNDPSQEK